MSIFILKVPFIIETRISVSALPSKMNRRLVWQKLAMRIKQDLPTYKRVNFFAHQMFGARKEMRPEHKKKSASLKLVHNSSCEFDPHRHWRRKASMRQYNGEGMISPWLNLRAEHVDWATTKHTVPNP
jgi:hypothetical protein